MSTESTDTISMVPHRLRNTAKKLATHMVAVAEGQRVWPDLLIGDDLAKRSIHSLDTIRVEVRHAAPLLERQLPSEYRLRHQRERDGLLNSADSLAELFAELSTYVDTDPERRRTLTEMQRQVHQLSYYTSRYIIWLEMLANLKAISSQNGH